MAYNVNHLLRVGDAKTIYDSLKTTDNALLSAILQNSVKGESTGNPIQLSDSATAKLISLTADADCDVTITGKNLISGEFDQVTFENRKDECVIVGKGSYEYCFPSRVSLLSISADSVKFSITASQVTTAGIGIYVAVRPETTYTLSYVTASENGFMSVLAYDADGAYLGSHKNEAENGYSFKTAENEAYVCAVFRCSVQNEEITFTNFQLEEGAIATEHVTYQTKQTVSVTAGAETNVDSVYSYYPVTNLSATNDATVTVKYYANTGNVIDETVEDLIKDIQKNAFVSSYNILDGWEPHAKAFAEMMLDVEQTEGFMFFTDSHFMAMQTESDWKTYAYAIFAYMEQLYYASPCSFVLHGGDWLGTGEAWENIIYKLSTIGGVFRSRFDKFALLVGNHETGNQSSEQHTTTHDTLAATLLSNVGKTYYAFNANTFKMFCFDSWVSGALDDYGKAQVKWFAEALQTETAEHIVIAIHALYDNGSLTAMGDELTKCAYAYNNGSEYTYDGETYDYSEAAGKVAFTIAGHTHTDSTGTANGIPYIITVNTTGYSETNFANLPLPVDLVRVDWKTKKLTAYRAARGASGTTREITVIA